MKGDRNLLNIHKTLKYRRNIKKSSNYPYNRTTSIHGRTTEKGKQYRR